MNDGRVHGSDACTRSIHDALGAHANESEDRLEHRLVGFGSSYSFEVEVIQLDSV
jgi:hypothetical protein